MSYESANARTAIIELLQGQIGSVRTVPSGVARYGVFGDQPTQAQIAKAFQKLKSNHVFDVSITPLTQSEASTVSANANRHLAEVIVRIDVWTRMQTTIQETDRREDLSTIESDVHTMARALHHPGNLRVTAQGNPTGIVSGMMLAEAGPGFPEWVKDVEDWAESQMVLHHISGRLILTVTDTPSDLSSSVVVGGDPIVANGDPVVVAP